MRILDEFTLHEVPMQNVSGGRRIIVRVSPHPTTSTSRKYTSEFVIYCNNENHPEVVTLVRTFQIWRFGDGPPVVLTVGGQTLVDDEPVIVRGGPVSAVGDLEELHVRLRAEGRGARGRFELRCEWCGRGAGRPNEAAPVVVRKETLNDHLQRLSGQGMSRLSLAGLRYILY